MTERNINKATEVGIEYAAEQAFDMLAIYYLDREREVAFQSFLYLFVALRESDIGLAFFLVDTMLRGIWEERFATLIGTAVGDDVERRNFFVEDFDEEQKQYWLGRIHEMEEEETKEDDDEDERDFNIEAIRSIIKCPEGCADDCYSCISDIIEEAFVIYQKAVYVRRQYRIPTRRNKVKKVGGLKGLYLHYCYLLGYLPKYNQNPLRVSPYIRDDLIKMEEIAKETRFICREKLEELLLPLRRRF